MADRYITGNVRCISTGIAGRHVVSARHNHLVVDDMAAHGGPGEAIGALELFMAGITGCATLMMERIANAEGVPLKRVEVSMDGTIDSEAQPKGPPVLASASLLFTMAGVEQAKAREMVETYKHR